MPASATQSGLQSALAAAKKTGCTITGTNGNDVLRGTSGNDVICARGGDDKIFGLGGNDILLGDSGADDIHQDVRATVRADTSGDHAMYVNWQTLGDLPNDWTASYAGGACTNNEASPTFRFRDSWDGRLFDLKSADMWLLATHPGGSEFKVTVCSGIRGCAVICDSDQRFKITTQFS
ncbi:MAG: hypothetical protein Q7L55_11770 [Actinomycetota bacterium]|nr:hypothetical protein [Actinomycetota bacterium]